MASRPIDEKIVAMKMDNSDFKRKAVETTGLFGRLKESLNRVPGVNLGKITNDLGGIQRAANNTDLGVLARSVDAIAGRFNALNVMATTALVNISNRAVDAGMRLAKSLGPQQMTDGFKEYELKMGSIQTMLSNTEWEGSTLDDVKKTLSELNAYADKTVYDFGQMTQAIGKWTAAGVGLKDSSIAIKGMGNLAASSGASVEQLNSAMYQMSQAMSAGKFGAIDWISLDNAGMGGKKTKDALMETAKAMGKNIDMSKGFKGSLEQGWLTAEVFLETMKKFGEDQSMTEAAQSVRTFTGMMAALKEGIGSGWAETWELVFGDFEEATRLWTAVSNMLGGIFQKQAEARNGMLRALIDGEAFPNLIQGIVSAATPIIQIFKAIGAGFRIAFPPLGTSGIEGLIAGFKNLTSGLGFSAESVKNIQTIFAGFFSMFAIGFKIIKGAVEVVLALLPSFSGLGSKILELIATVASIPLAFNNATSSSEGFGSAMDFLKMIASGVAGALELIVGGLITFASTVAMAFGVLSSGEVSDGPWKDSKITDWLLKAREGFDGLKSAMGKIDWAGMGSSISAFFGGIKDGFGWIIDKAVAVGNAIKNAIPDGNQLLAGGFIAGMVAMVGMAIKMAWDMYDVFTGWGKIGAGVAETLEGVGGALESFAFQVKAQALLTIAIAVGVLAGAFLLLSRLNSEDIVKGLYAMIGSLTAVVTAMAIMTKYDITGTGFAAALQIVALSLAFAILAGAIKKISTLGWEEISKGLVGLIGVMGTFSLAMIAISKWGGAQVGASALQMVAIAGAMHILVSAIKRIANIDIGDLVKGTATIGAVLLALGVFLKMTAKSKFGVSSAVGIAAIAGAIWMMTIPIKKLGEMNIGTLKQGLQTIGMVLLTIAAFSLVTSTGGLLATGAGLVLLAGALTLMMVPIMALGNMDMGKLAQGLIAMGIALVAIGAASMLMTGMIAAGAGLILVAAGLHMLLLPITALGNMDIKKLAIGIGALAIGILAIGGAAALLGLAAAPMLLGAAGIAAIGIAMLAAGAGIALFGAGLVTLAGMTGTAVATIVGMLGTLIMGLVSLIPTMVNFISEITMKVLDAMNTHGPVILNKLYDFAIKMLNVFRDRIPEFALAATDVIVAFLDSMAVQLPRIVESATNLMIAMIEALAVAVATNGPRFINAFKTLMAEVSIIMVEAGLVMVNALFGWIPGVQEATKAIGQNADTYIRETFRAEEIGNEKGDDFVGALESKTGDAQVAGTSLAKNAEEGVDSAQLGTSGENQGSDFATGVGSKAGDANASGTALAQAGKSGAESINITSSGTFFAQGFADGIGSSSVMSKVTAAAKGLASAADYTIRKVLGIHSPADATIDSGKWTGQGFADGVKAKTGETKQSANSIAGVVMNALGIKAPVAKESAKGGKVAGESFSKGVSSTKKSSEKAGKETGKSLAKGLKSSKKDAEKAAKEAAQKIKDAFRKAMEDIDYKVEMEEINTAQQIAAVEKLKKQYAKYPDIVRETNLKLKKLRDQQTKEIEDAFKKRMDAQKKTIDERKYHNNMSLMQELAAWQKILNQYKKGTAERAEADREVFRVKNEINNKLKEINEDYLNKVQEANQKLKDGEKELRDEYAKTVADRAKSLANYVGLFEKVNEMEVVKGEDLIENLKGQNRLFERWSSNIWALSKKGLDTGLIDELREMGPQAADSIEALNNMTAQQLTEYNNLWKNKHQLARNSASTELTQLKKDTETKIKELHAQTSKQLTEYQKLWAKSIAEIKTWSKDGFVGLNTDMKSIGADSIKGLMKGMSDMEPSLKRQATNMANNIANTIAKALKVKSPSRVLMAIGQFAGEGLAVGMDNRSKQVEMSSRDMAKTAVESIQNVMDGFQLDEGDNELHFKAVIDYDKIDPKQLGNVASMNLQPNTAFANSLISSAKAGFRQNGNNNPTVVAKSENDKEQVDNEPKQPIILQTYLNSRILAEETYEDINALIGVQSNLNMAMR